MSHYQSFIEFGNEKEQIADFSLTSIITSMDISKYC